MTTANAATYPTLLDVAKRLDPNGMTAQIVELLSQSNPILEDMVAVEGNLPTGHRTTVRTGLPSVAWRLLNGGVLSSKSTTAQIDEACGMLEAFSVVDRDLARLNGNIASFSLSEATAYIEAMNQEMAQTLIYGNAGTAPEEFTGLAARYSAISGAGNAQNVCDAGGTGSDNSSIWLVAWGPQTVHGIFPKGSLAGLQHEDRGEVEIQNANGVTGAFMIALMDHWQWKFGIALKDWRYVVRICNIDISNLVADSSAADLTDQMERAMSCLPNALGKPVFYMNRTVMRKFRKQAREDVTSGGGLNYTNVHGQAVYDFDGIPVRVVDQILNTEARVT